MSSNRFPFPTLALLLLVTTSCASAGKRLEQGMEAEAEGDYHAAVARYIQALEKDNTLTEARQALAVAWDSAVARGMDAAGTLSRTDPVAAAEEFLVLDDLSRDALAAGIRLNTRRDFGRQRRQTLDSAIGELMARGDALRDDGRWRDAREAYRRVFDDMDPLRAQRRASLDAQSAALVEWARDEGRRGRFQSSFRRAEEALSVDPEIPEDVAETAIDLQERALSAGLRILAVFPVGSSDAFRQAALTELEGPLSDMLETEHWQRPPLFVGVADPARVRQATRRYSPPGSTFRPRRVLTELGADFGALIDLVELLAEERDVKGSTRTARTTSGEATSYTLEEGRIQYSMVAEVTLYDERGTRLESFRVRKTGAEGFERARYSGRFEDLDLSRSERILFNPGVEREQRALLQESILEDLATDIAGGTYERVLRRIP